jgi:hypothetical protein
MQLAQEGMGTVERTFRRRMNQTSSGADLRGDLATSRGLLFFNGLPSGEMGVARIQKEFPRYRQITVEDLETDA